MKRYSFTPRGVCSRNITFELEGNIIKDVKFTGGCSGNAQGISALAKGMQVEKYIERCKGITCGNKSSSCPAQFALALEQAMTETKE